jgi:hypothetical protein
MHKSLLVIAIALTSINVASASSFLAQDPVEQSMDKDTAFDNAAFLLSTKNQVTFSDFGDAGIVFNAFGQKLAIHTGRSNNALDVFWGATLGFGHLGLRGGLEIDNSNDLLNTSYFGQANYTYVQEDGASSIVSGADTASLNVLENIDTLNTSEYQLEAGILFSDLPIEGTLRFSLPTFNDVETFDFVDTLNTDGTTTATYQARNTHDETSSTVSDGGLVLSASSRYKLNSNTHVTGSVDLNNRNFLTTNRIVDTQLDTDIAGGNTVDVNETTTTETTSSNKDNELTLSIGVDYRRFVGPAMVKFQPVINYQKSSDTDTSNVVVNTFVDALDANNNTTAATGVSDITTTESTDVDLTVRVSTEFLASPKWTWRAGANVGVIDYAASKTTYTQNTAQGSNYVLDYVSVTNDDSSFEMLDFTTVIDLGFTFRPAEAVAFDINLEANRQALQNWSADFALTLFY